jgi:hypothetical protein
VAVGPGVGVKVIVGVDVGGWVGVAVAVGAGSKVMVKVGVDVGWRGLRRSGM